MSQIEDSIIINRTAEEIFTFFSSAENHARFIPGMIEIKQTSPGLFAQVGATARGIRRDVVINTEVRYEITQVETNKKLGMKGAMGPLLFDDGYALEPMGSPENASGLRPENASGLRSTRVNFWLEFNLTGPMLLTKPFIQFLGKTHAAETLANLKKVLETTK